MMQVIHESDVVGALVHAVVNDVPGVFNVAAEDHMPLHRLMSLAGKLALPVFHLFAYWGTGLLGAAGLPHARFIPIELDSLRYACMGDLQRMRQEMGFTPHYTAEEALREFAGHQRMTPYRKESAGLVYDEERLKDTLERRKRLSQRKASHPIDGHEQDEPEEEQEGASHE
jgi:nucleoside-diphosphate-sugar epimerase